MKKSSLRLTTPRGSFRSFSKVYTKRIYVLLITRFLPILGKSIFHDLDMTSCSFNTILMLRFNIILTIVYYFSGRFTENTPICDAPEWVICFLKMLQCSISATNKLVIRSV